MPAATMKRFRIIAGKYESGKGRTRANPNQKCLHFASRDKITGELRKDANGKELPDVIETDKNLIKLFGDHKFVRLHAPVDDGLSGMSVKELTEYAQGEEIDLGGSTKKEDILSRIRIAIG